MNLVAQVVIGIGWILISPPLPGDRRRTLAWVNRQRLEDGRDPIASLPHGVEGDAFDCPIQNGLGRGEQVRINGVGFSYDNRTRLPRYCRAFIWTFDLGFRRNTTATVADLTYSVTEASKILTNDEAKVLRIESELLELRERVESLEAHQEAALRGIQELRVRIRELARERDALIV